MENQFKRYVVMLDNFGHDTCGNAIARHTVFGYREANANIKYPSLELYVTKQRKQIGCSNLYDKYAESALDKACARHDLVFTRKEGDKSDGHLYLIYDVQT